MYKICTKDIYLRDQEEIKPLSLRGEKGKDKDYLYIQYLV